MLSLARLFPLQCRSRLVSVAAAAVLLTVALGAESLTGIPNPRARDGTWVTDMPGALRSETIARLNSTIGELERSNTAEMTVVVIKSLDGLAIEEAAVKLFELWGIGKKHKDNGLLFLWSTGDRRVRVEVGYGLEGALPDGKVGAILDTYVIPKFKTGNFDEGVLAGVDALVRVAREEPVELASARSESYEPTSWGLARVLAGVPAPSWRRLARSSACGDGAATAGGVARKCDAWMTRLAETEDDEMLASGQQAEERVGCVDYDVWKCATCSHHFIIRYPKWITGYAKCPQCRNRTKSSSETVVERATTSSSGSAQVVESCAFCTFRTSTRRYCPGSSRARRPEAGRPAEAPASAAADPAAEERVAGIELTAEALADVLHRRAAWLRPQAEATRSHVRLLPPVSRAPRS